MIELDEHENRRVSKKNDLERCLYSFESDLDIINNNELTDIHHKLQNWLSDDGCNQGVETYDRIITVLKGFTKLLENKNLKIDFVFNKKISEFKRNLELLMLGEKS